MRWAVRVVPVVVAAVVLAQVSRLGSLAPLIVGGALVVVNLVIWLVTWRSAMPRRRGGGDQVGQLTMAWLAVSMLPAHNFAARSSTAALGSASVQPVVELTVFGLVLVLAIAIVRVHEPTLDRAQPPWLLFLLPVWCAASAVWGETGPYSIVRSWQMAVIAMLAWATLAAGRADPGAVVRVVDGVFRWFVRITAVLVALGAAFGTIYVTVSVSNRGRFGWIGAHPTSAGLILSVAIVITAASSPESLRMPPLVRYGLLAAFTVAMYENHSRASWVCLAVGLLGVFALKGHLTRALRWVGTPWLVGSAVAVAYFSGESVLSYLLRDQSSDQVLTGNGRRDLWTIGFRALETPFDWVFGLGYGITRTVFQEQTAWNAGEAHNSVLAWLVSVGLVGVLLFFVVLVVTVVRLVASGQIVKTAHGITVAGLLLLLVVNGLTSDTLAEPTLGLALLYLIAVVAMVGMVPEPSTPRPLEPSSIGAS